MAADDSTFYNSDENIDHLTLVMENIEDTTDAWYNLNKRNWFAIANLYN